MEDLEIEAREENRHTELYKGRERQKGIRRERETETVEERERERNSEKEQQ